jgi:hypothetical protein
MRRRRLVQAGRIRYSKVTSQMAVLCRRFILLLVLAFWQGGFMFYGGVVVPVGAERLRSEIDQGFITQSVTNYLNCAGTVCLAAWGMTLWLDARHVPKWRGLGWVLWSALLLGLVVIVSLHLMMDRLLDLHTNSILDKRAFRPLHRIYLATSTAQWFASLALLAITLKQWQTVDHGPRDSYWHGSKG